MAYLREETDDFRPQGGSSRISAFGKGALRWVALPMIGIAVISWSAATLASLHSAAALSRAGGFEQASLFLQPRLKLDDHRPAPSGKAVMIASPGQARQLAHFTREAAPKPAEVQAPADPFAKVIAEAKLSREKLHAVFASAGMEIAALEEAVVVPASLAMPSAERFHRMTDALASAEAAPAEDPLSSLVLGQTGLNVELAYAAVETDASNQMQLALASLDLDPFDTGLPDAFADEALPDSIDIPQARPSQKPAGTSAEKPARQLPDVAEEPSAPARKPRGSERMEAQQALAYARPDKPAAGAFKNFFNTPKAGNGVAIYDISAAVVHMPDGSKLEAHSGIGKMADNPRYVHVKMNGPTPPNTYKLSMREKRFHGVEAVRMTPIGKETMHGRNGILAHSYLLRGGRAESHGCVAFKDYNRFLKAFKQGKVTHIVVVPSLSRGPKTPKIQLVSNGRES